MATGFSANDFVIDPNADTIIILVERHTEFAQWNEEEGCPDGPLNFPDMEHQGDKSVADNESWSEAQVEASHDEDAEHADHEIRFFVSSRHLILASKYFEKALGQKWEHHPRDEQSRVLVFEENWTSDQFRMLMSIIHGRTRTVPRTLTLDQLAEIGVMIDYYACAEVVEAYSPYWIAHLRGKLPTSYCRDLILWM